MAGKAAKAEKKALNNKDIILREATKLFFEYGYHATTTAEICRAANVNTPTLYYHFKDKRHLFYSCHMKSLEDILSPYIRRAETVQDPGERLQFIIREFTGMICSNPELRMFIHETLSMKDEYFAMIRKEWKAHYKLLQNTISQLQLEGVARKDIKASWAALLVLGAMTWITYWFDYSRKNQVKKLSENANNMLLEGLLIKKAGNPKNLFQKATPLKKTSASLRR